jgi:hypothetical protein
MIVLVSKAKQTKIPVALRSNNTSGIAEQWVDSTYIGNILGVIT